MAYRSFRDPGTAVTLTALAFMFVAPTAFGYAYERRAYDEYTVLCSAVRSTELPEQSLERYELAADPHVGVLSCSLQRQVETDRIENVPAHVKGYVQTLVGHRTPISFKEILEGDWISYVGTYPIESPSALKFVVSLEHAKTGREFAVEFDDVRPVP